MYREVFIMKGNVKTFVVCVAVPLVVGLLSSFFSGMGMGAFAQLNKPPLSPPGILFPIVWTILYVLMGIASYLVLTSGASARQIKEALALYGAQLFVNFWWSIFFFRFEWYFFSFLWLLLLWLLIYLTLQAFYGIRSKAGYLLVPYLLWVTFAGYLNFFIFLLN